MTPVIPPPPVPAAPTTEEDNSGFNIWAAFDRNIEQVLRVSSSSVVSENTEMRRYLEESPIRRHQDPLQWWACHEGLFPQLAKLAKKYLGIPATSVPSERLFSVAGELVSSMRANLSDDKIDMILFLTLAVRRY